MSCIAILDLSCIIWDVNDYQKSSHEYLILMNKLMNLFDVLDKERPYILLRDELVAEIIERFPFESVPNNFYGYTTRVFEFISNIPEGRKLSCLPQDDDITSIPSISKNHFSSNAKIEVAYFLTHIHGKQQPENCFFTYPYLYESKESLTTIKQKGQPVVCKTMFIDDSGRLDEYFLTFKRVFQPNPVHHTQNRPNSRKSKLRCYNGVDTNVPQEYLDRAIFENNRYYFYDAVHQIYVVFFAHFENKYHGHEEATLSKIPVRIRQHFNI